MSFFRNLFESKPAQTDQEYTISLIDQLLDGKASPYLISNIREFSHQYPDEISSRGIPDLIKALSDFSENDDVIKDLITVFAELLRTDNMKKDENAKIFIQCDDTFPNIVRNLDNKNPQIRVGSMHVLMMIANLQPALFTESLTSHQPQMIRLFGSISDQNEQISSKFVTVIPKLVENNPDFQQIVGFYAFEALVNSINRERPEFLEALISVLKDNQINQSLFINSGFLSTIEKMLKTPDEKILDLMLLLFDPYKNSNNLESFRKNLEPTNIINIICDNITRNVYRPLHIHLLSVCIKGNQNLTDRTKEKVSDFVRLALETRKSATINNGNNSYLDGIDLFGEFFESFVFESEENSHFLNLTIINSQNIGFDGLTENFLNLCTFSILIAPNCKNDFDDIFNSLISNIRRYENVSSMFKFFVCFCWQSKEYCDKISSDDNLTILIQLLIGDKNKNNSFFVPNSDSNSNEKRNRYLLLLFAEIILFSGRNRAKLGTVVNTTILPYELEDSIKQLENSEYKDNSKYGQLENQIFQYINENHLNDSLKQNDDDDEDNDFYKSEYDRLQKENNELKSKINENDANLTSLKIENDDKTAKIQSLQSQIDELSNKAVSKGIQLDDHIEDDQKILKIEDDQKEKIDDLLNQISELKSQLEENSKDQLVAQIESLSSQLEESNKNNESLQEQNKNSSNEIDQLRSSLENAKSNSDDLQKQIREMDDTVSSLQSQNEALQNKIEKKSIETTELIEKFNKEIAELRSQQSLAGGELISSLNSQIEELKNENNKQKQEFENEKEILNQNILKLQSENSKLEEDKNNLLENDELQQKIKDIDDLNEEKEKLVKQTESLKSQMKKNNEMNQDEIENLRNQIDEIKSNSIPNEEVESIKKANIEITKKCCDLNQKIYELENQLKNKTSTQLNEENNIDELLRIKVDELENQLQNVTNESAEKDEMISSLKSQVKEAKKAQKANDKVANDLRKTNNDLQDQVTQMLKQIEELQLLTQYNHLFNLNSPKEHDAKNREIEIEYESSKKSSTKTKSVSKEARNETESDFVIKSLNDKIEQLNNQISNLQDENNDLKIQVSQSNKDEENESALKPLKEQIEKLNNQINNLQDENNDLKIQASQSNKNEENELVFNPLKEQIEQLNNQISYLQDENNNLKNQVSQSENHEKESQNEENELIIKSLNLQIEQLNNQINNLQDKNNDLQIQLSQSTNQESNESTTEQLKEQIEQLNNKIDNLQDQNSNLQNQLSQSTNQEPDESILKPFKEKIEQQNNQINNLRDENNNLKIQVSQSEKQKTESENKSNELIEKQHKQQIEKLNNQINKLQKQNNNLQNQLSKSANQKSNESILKQQIEQLNNQINDLQNKNSELKVQLSQVKHQETNKELKDKIVQYEKLVVSLQEENIKLQQQYQSKNRENVDDKMNEEEDSSDSLDRSLNEQKNELIASLSSIKKGFKEMQDHASRSGLIDSSNDEEEEEAKKKSENRQNDSKSDDKSHSKSINNNESILDSETKSKYESIMAKQRKLIDSYRAQIEKLEESSVEATKAAENLASQNEKLKSEIKAKTAEFNRSTQDLKKKLSQVTKEFNAIQNRSNKTKSHNSKGQKIDDLDDYNLFNSSEETSKTSVLNRKIDDLQAEVSLLKTENNHLKNSPSKALVSALQVEKTNLEEKVYKLEEELSKLKIEKNKQKETDSNDDLLSSFPISPISQKTSKKQQHTKTSKRNDEKDLINKLLTENEILKRDNENQSHTITDLQLMLEMQNIASDGQMFMPTSNGSNVLHLPYATFDDELKNLTVENEILNSKLKEMNSIEIENKKLMNENMELKKLIRNRNASFVNDFTPTENIQKESPNLSELKQRKALRVIGKLYLDNQQQKLNM